VSCGPDEIAYLCAAKKYPKSRY